MEELRKIIQNKSNFDFSNAEFSDAFDKIIFFINLIDKDNFFDRFNLDTKKNIIKNSGELANQIKNFQANNDIKYIQLMNYYLSKIYSIILSEYDNIKEILLNKIVKIENELSGTIKDYKSNIDSIKRSIDTIDNLRMKSEKLTNNIAKSHKDTTKIISDYINDIKNETDKRIDAKRAAIDKKLVVYQEKIEDRIDTIVKKFSENIKSWDKKFDELEGKKDDFEKTLKIATTYYRESRFDDYSAEQKKEADFYRKLSLQLMIIVVIIILGITIWNIIDVNNTKWHHYFTRSLLAFTLMIPAIYTSRESASHRRNAEKYTQMANELTAFEATLKIDDLDNEIKNKIKEEIYKRYFGNILFEQKDVGDSITEFFKNMAGKEKN